MRVAWEEVSSSKWRIRPGGLMITIWQDARGKWRLNCESLLIKGEMLDAIDLVGAQKEALHEIDDILAKVRKGIENAFTLIEAKRLS